MKVAVIGSRNLQVQDLGMYMPKGVTEIVSGGARGIDRCAARYAQTHGFKLTEFLPDYEAYGRGAPLRRNLQIINYADLVLAFWDGKSTGTFFTIRKCREAGKPVKIFVSAEGACGRITEKE